MHGKRSKLARKIIHHFVHHSHLCGEGGEDVELIYMRGECKVCSLVCTLTGFYLFHVSPDRL